ncbi:MAG: VWA-like domain-containing protein [Clostridium sp.]|nr:VWA-like domain-containing protein [Clostridium sp.]
MVSEIAEEIFELARADIMVKYRYFDVALLAIRLKEAYGYGKVGLRGDALCHDPVYIVQNYRRDGNYAVRLYLHVIMHKIFFHENQLGHILTKKNAALSDEKRIEYWNLAADMAAEAAVLDLTGNAFYLAGDDNKRQLLEKMGARVPRLTAQLIYRELVNEGIEEQALLQYGQAFFLDCHDAWLGEERNELIINKKQWEKISERLSSDIKNFSKKRASHIMEDNLWEGQKKYVSYNHILEHFLSYGEETTASPDEFDYAYYMYGLRLYGAMPLIEPLEYREADKIRELVIAIDTSASCKGEHIRGFLQRTYDIFRAREHFFDEFHILILLCDDNIISEEHISNWDAFQTYVKNVKVSGYGGTDFRPVFEKVEMLINNGTIRAVNGLIYFTDGYGIYPENAPDYKTAFAFLNEDKNRHEVPWWAIKTVLEEELYEY